MAVLGEKPMAIDTAEPFAISPTIRVPAASVLDDSFRTPTQAVRILPLRDPSRGPRPANNEAAAAAARGEHSQIKRRLPLGYSRFGDARPGRRQIGSRRSAGRGDSLNQSGRL